MMYNQDYRHFQYPIEIQLYVFFIEKIHLQRQFLMFDEIQYVFDVIDHHLDVSMIINSHRIYQLKFKKKQYQ
jgi:hypothetical protein